VIDVAPTQRLLDYSIFFEAAGCGGDPLRAPIWPTPGDVCRSCPWTEGLSLQQIRGHERYLELGAVTAQRRAAFLLGLPRFDIPWLQPRCPFCRTLVSMPVDIEDVDRGRAIRVVVCEDCGWWSSRDACELRQDDDGEHLYFGLRRAALRSFAISDTDIPVDLLQQHLIRHPEALRQVNPRSLEDLVGSIFADFFNCEAIHIGGPGDGGVDLVLVDGDQRRVVQVKRRQSASKAESVAVVREFVGAMVVGGEVEGIVVTTAPSFSPSAQEAALKATQHAAVEKIDLIDAGSLLDICGLIDAPAPAWQNSAHSIDQAPDALESDLVSEAVIAAEITPYSVPVPYLAFDDISAHARDMITTGLAPPPSSAVDPGCA
jgi:hypothetical protein